MDAGRYHLTLTAAGRTVQHGWWDREAVALRKFSGWVGEYGSMAGARITLVDGLEDRVLAAWPAAVSGDT